MTLPVEPQYAWMQGKGQVSLFVSKLPQAWGEPQITALFGEHGEVDHVRLIHDSQSGGFKGCAFVRMLDVASAASAIKRMNNVKVLDPAAGPVNIVYADGEVERLQLPNDIEGAADTKLFVGGVMSAAAEPDLRQAFARFGTVTELAVIPEKMFAFVRMSRREDAQSAINALNNTLTPAGNTRPVEVRFAESKSTKLERTAGGSGGKGWGKGWSGGGGYQSGGGSMYQRDGGFQQPQPTPAPGGAPRVAGPWVEYFASDGRPYYHNQQTNQTTWDTPQEFKFAPAPLASGQPHFDTGSGGGFASGGGGDPIMKGPLGSNVFVFSLPVEWDDAELRRHFDHFGNMLSARVMRDRETGASKGFGFLSFDNVTSARNAVAGMNGFMATRDGRRLKVSIKKGEEAAAGMPVPGGPMPFTNGSSPY